MKLKHTALVLLFFMCFIGYVNAQENDLIMPRPLAAPPPPAPTPPPPPAPTPPPPPPAPPAPTPQPIIRWLVPVTTETVNAIQNYVRNSRDYQKAVVDLRGLRFYLSKPVTISSVQNSNSRDMVGVANGAPVWGVQNNSSGRVININAEVYGNLRTIDSDNIVVIFNGTPLKFRRNSQGIYELFAAELDVVTYSLRYEGRPPQLLMLDDAEGNNLEIQAVPNSVSGGSQRRINDQQQRPNPGGGQNNRDSDRPYQETNQSRNIADRGCVTVRGITEYVMRQNSSADRAILSSLINTYIREAEIEGINHDIAIAQMLYATNNLGNERITTHNYVGLSSTSGWDGSFRDMPTGVRAHIQHLKGLASTSRPNQPIVDPRYQILAELGYLGTVRTFDDLYRHWTANSNYGNSIDGILNGLYRFSA